MEISSYYVCLFIIKDGGENLGIAGFQTGNTLNVRIEVFIKKKETKIIGAKFQAKNQTILETGISRDFNGYRMPIKIESIRKNKLKSLS